MHQYLLGISGCIYWFISKFPRHFLICATGCDTVNTQVGGKKLLPEKQLFKQLAAQRRLRIALLKPFSCIPYSPLSTGILSLWWSEIPRPADCCLGVLFLLKLQGSLSTLSPRPEGTAHSFPPYPPCTCYRRAVRWFWWSISDFFNIGCSSFMVWQLIDKSSFVGWEWLTFSSGIPIIE